MRTVTAAIGWPYTYRCRVVPARSAVRRRKGWRYVVERYWCHWDRDHTSGWFLNYEQAKRAANAFLDAKAGPGDKGLI